MIDNAPGLFALRIAIYKLFGMRAQQDGEPHQFLHHIHDAVVERGRLHATGVGDVTPSFPPAGIRVGRLFCASARLKQWAA